MDPAVDRDMRILVWTLEVEQVVNRYLRTFHSHAPAHATMILERKPLEQKFSRSWTLVSLTTDVNSQVHVPSFMSCLQRDGVLHTIQEQGVGPQ